MLETLKVNLTSAQLISAIKKMKKRERDSFIEVILAATSPEYIESIKKARSDYKAGKTKTHEEVFGK